MTRIALSYDEVSRRLAEAQATITALLAGEIDAVVDATSKSPVLLAKAQQDLRISEARYREQARTLQENEARTNFALGAAQMGLWEIDLATHRLTWSPTTAALYGLRPDQAPTGPAEFFALVHADDHRLVEDALERTISEGVDFSLDFRILWPDGSVHWTAGRARLMRDALGAPLRVIGVGIDISAQRVLEAKYLQAQKMEVVGQLAAGVAHDFNNLLTVVLLYSDLVIQTLTTRDPRRADLEQVVLAGQSATALTRQLLAFSRKQVLQPSSMSINDLVTNMTAMLTRSIGENIELVTLLSPDLHTVRADHGQVEQVLVNLVVNARDAMPDGGRITVETANVDLDASFKDQISLAPGAYVMLAVSDNGVGMTDATRQRLFEPFFTTKDPGKGTGLGLATVYGIVTQSGGNVWVSSALGKGASFKVYLPRSAGEDEKVEINTTKRAEAGGTETVLVVEDEDSVRLITRRILEHSGYTVLDAPNPELADAIFASHMDDVKLLVTDVIMPGSNGPSLFARLKRKRPALNVLYVSGYTDDTIAHQGQLDPGIDYLQKPFTADALNRMVRSALDRGTTAREAHSAAIG